MAALLGKSRQTVAKDPKLLALTTRAGRIVYPTLQFDGRRPWPGLGEIVVALSAAFTPWTIASWLITAQPALDGATPLDRIRDGDVDTVTGLARDAADTAS